MLMIIISYTLLIITIRKSNATIYRHRRTIAAFYSCQVSFCCPVPVQERLLPGTGQLQAPGPSVQELYRFGPSVQDMFRVGPRMQDLFRVGLKSQDLSRFGPRIPDMFRVGPRAELNSLFSRLN